MRAAAESADTGRGGWSKNARTCRAEQADIVGIHPRIGYEAIDRAAVAELAPASIEAKIERVRSAAAAVGRPMPRLQFMCYHLHVTDAGGGHAPRSSWAAHVERERDLLSGSPAILVGTAAECAEKLLEWRERFGITYWHLGANVDAVAMIIEQVRLLSGVADTGAKSSPKRNGPHGIGMACSH